MRNISTLPEVPPFINIDLAEMSPEQRTERGLLIGDYASADNEDDRARHLLSIQRFDERMGV